MSVQFKVSSLLKEAVGSTREYDVDARVLVDEEEPRRQAVIGQVRFLRTKDGVLVTASLCGDLKDQCSRCVRDLDIPVQVEIEEEFIASADINTGATLPAPEDPEAFRIDEHHVLDLEDAIRQYWTTAVPIKPLCDPGCRGLCPRCGQDLNEAECSCPPDVDERWSALRQLAGEMKRS